MSKTVPVPLELSNVSYNHGNKQILKDINLKLEKGKIISIIGLNGAGKTTLLKIISGILKPTTGKIKRAYKTLSYVPQKINIDKTFPIKVSEFINIYNKNPDKKYLKNLFKKFDSSYLIDKEIGKISSGELQKVLIISALIKKPEIILLDEPTASVDMVSEEIFYKIISQIKEIFPDISVVLVSHNLNLVYKNSDYIICLHKDNYCCHGTPKEIGQNKKVANIFGKYFATYSHNPHKK